MQTILKCISTTALMVAILAVLSARPASAVVVYVVTINTASVAGTTGFLDFQFNPGNSTSQPATAEIMNFNPDGGTLGAPIITGSVTGALPGTVTFTNSTALNELFQGFTYGTSISFVLFLSGPAIDSPNGIATAGTTFGIGLYDATQNPILTTQPTGFAAQVDINPDGTTAATGFSPAGGGPSVVTFSFPPAEGFQVRYASNLNIGDSVINVTNNGATARVIPGPLGFTGGNLCINAYVFDQSEEMLGCCSCFVTPNGLQSMSVKNSLISNNLTPEIPNSVVIKLLATAAPTGGSVASCNASTPNFGTVAAGMRAWGTSLHALPTAPASFGITETPFSPSYLSLAELNHLTGFCGFIQSNASGFGICKGCNVGGLGGVSVR